MAPHVQPELHLFEVYDIGNDGDDDLSHHYLPNFKQLQLGFQMSQRGTKKKENHLNTISKMMGTLVQVQLYTFSYRKALFRPQIMPKIADWGVKTAKIAKSKNMLGPKRQHFQNPTDKISSEQLRKVEKIKPFSHSRASKKNIKKGHKTSIFLVLGNLTHIYFSRSSPSLSPTAATSLFLLLLSGSPARLCRKLSLILAASFYQRLLFLTL